VLQTLLSPGAPQSYPLRDRICGVQKPVPYKEQQACCTCDTGRARPSHATGTLVRSTFFRAAANKTGNRSD
jgi:hypothetical protein